jgi:glycosyltransferase involved in cell wall biosynthesis
LQTRVAALGLGDRVAFVDWLEPRPLAALLARARAAVLPSREESFGNAIAEAMAVGCPVIATRVGSVPEIVDADRTGVLVPPDDPAALAEAIDALLADPDRAAALARAGREHVRARFTWDAVAASFEDLYRSGPS